MGMDSPKTLQEAILYFADFDRCREFLMDLRWPGGKVTCPQCGSDHVVYLAKARVWKCYGKHSSPKFSLKTGTIFEDSPLGLDKWLAALWLLVNCKNGISSCEIARSIGITQKSAWFMAHRLRFALHYGSFDKLSGDVEIDETYIGGRARNMHPAKKARVMGGRRGGLTGKAAVMGLLDRHGKDAVSQVRTVVLDGRKRRHIQPEVWANVQEGSAIYTDRLMSYDGLGTDYAHSVIDHAEKYVDGNVHTNGLENYWSLLKRMIKGTYVSVEPFHLFRYLDEQAYRFNNRKGLSDFERFKIAASQIVDKRLTWKQAIGVTHDSATCLN